MSPGHPGSEAARRASPGAFRYYLRAMAPSLPLQIPSERADASRSFAELFVPGRRVAMTTHVNADGDGVGSEVGLWHLLTGRRCEPFIVNPTPIPDRFGFLIPAGADQSGRGVRALERAEAVVVLDIADLGRLGPLAGAVRDRGVPVACIDHHVSPGTLPDGPRLVAPEATATAELVFDLASALEWPISPDAARALYVGILTDTGGFRFSNTTARALRVAAALLERGVEPETIYEQVYASAPEGRIRLLSEVLQTLVVEPEVGLAWVTVPADALDRHGATADDLDGIVEFPRSIAGVRLSLLFRSLANGRIKVSFRSMGTVDVSELAHQFGGGGHRKAAGASLEGSVAAVQERVLQAARAYLRAS
ncbi:MAG TPA: bifunctional oligoribonuclease/PAP phosphatase NrnA [Gemmatimonadales bacterium]|nr:bifunctional oligoribonuclease/PAP phosphatase NrnA [Gemmatimonadales bacterium]